MTAQNKKISRSFSFLEKGHNFFYKRKKVFIYNLYFLKFQMQNLHRNEYTVFRASKLSCKKIEKVKSFGFIKKPNLIGDCCREWVVFFIDQLFEVGELHTGNISSIIKYQHYRGIRPVHVPVNIIQIFSKILWGNQTS